MLRWAHKKELIQRVPHFDKINRSKQRKTVADIELVKKVINHLDPYYINAFKILAIYPIRPCDIRCLRWLDIDLDKRTISISRHLSGKDENKGRKSLKEDHEKGTLTYPLTQEAYEIFNSMPFPIDKALLVFPSKVGHNKIMSHGTLPENWNKACDRAKVKRFQSYEVKHARITEISELSNGNMIEVMEASGHTNINTVMRYSKGKSNLNKIFN